MLAMFSNDPLDKLTKAALIAAAAGFCGLFFVRFFAQSLLLFSYMGPH